jgi:hypothetical protein
MLKAELWIRIHWIRIRIQGFDDQNLKKKIQIKSFSDQKLQFTYVQATREAYSPQIEHPSVQKIKVINFFQGFWLIFALLDPDPDRQHWLKDEKNVENAL